MFTSSDEVRKFIKDEDVEFVDVRFTDLPGQQQHFNVPAADAAGRLLHRGRHVRRLVDPRVRADPQVRHEADPRRHDRLRRPVPGREDAQPQLLDRRAAHRRAVRARPAPGGGQGRAVAGQHRHRRHRLLRPGGRVLRLRRRPVPDLAERGFLPHRLHRGRLEHRPRRGGRQPRLQDALQGRLLPGAAGRPLRRPARPDDARADRQRAAGRARAPRGGHRRPGRDQLQVQHAARPPPTTC